MKSGFKQELLKLPSPHNWLKMPLIRKSALGKKSSLSDTINMGKSSQKKLQNDSQIVDLGTTQLN